MTAKEWQPRYNFHGFIIQLVRLCQCLQGSGHFHWTRLQRLTDLLSVRCMGTLGVRNVYKKTNRLCKITLSHYFTSVAFQAAQQLPVTRREGFHSFRRTSKHLLHITMDSGRLDFCHDTVNRTASGLAKHSTP
jgi:hypothetical protein